MRWPSVVPVLLSLSLMVPGAFGAESLRVERDKVLHRDMKVVPVTPPVVSTATGTSGLLWSKTVLEPRPVLAVRIHVVVRQGRPAGDWKIVVRNLSGAEVESLAGDSPQVASGELWTREVSGRGATIELHSNAGAQGLEIAIDRYAHRIVAATEHAITGLDQRRSIEDASAEVKRLGQAIARLTFMSDQFQFNCTGFLVTRTLMLTNEHCLATPSEALSAIVEFGYDSQDATPQTLRVKKLEATSAPLDYSLVRLTEAAPAELGVLALGTTAAAEDQELTIIQHPAGEPKQISIDDCRVKGPSRPGTGGGTTDFGHLCDTLGGSSGSPVLARQGGRVLGLHHWGFSASSPNPVNQAVHIGQVLSDLKTRVPSLHAEILGTP